MLALLRIFSNEDQRVEEESKNSTHTHTRTHTHIYIHTVNTWVCFISSPGHASIFFFFAYFSLFIVVKYI